MSKKLFFLVLVMAVIVLVGGVLASRQRLQLQPKEQPFSHAPDYSWVTGQLYYSDLEGGFWGLRYGEKKEDKYGGHFVLGKSLPGDFKDGDLVLLKGQIAEEQVSISMAGWIYKVEKIERLRF